MGYKDIDIAKVLKVKNSSSVALKEPPGYKGKLKGFQKKGVAYMYFAKRCGLFDSCGTGKTHHIMALACLLKSRNELGRALYLVPGADILAKVDEFEEFTSLNFAAAAGNKSDRLQVYSAWFDLIIVSYEVARGNDFEILKEMEFDTIFLDESHVFRNENTKTARVVHTLTESADRVYTLSATPIQMSLLDLHTQATAWHNSIFGSNYSFKRRYCIEEEVVEWRGTRRTTKKVITGYRNMDEFKKIIDPFYLRRSIADVEDELPELITEKRWGNLTEEQAKLYNELKRGTVRLVKEGQLREAKRNIHSMQKVINSTAALGSDTDSSWKMDYIMSELQDTAGFGGSMSKEKVVLFAQHKDTLKVMQDRLDTAGIGYVVMTGDETKENRNAYRKQFWKDPKCRVMLGTTAIECSANLHCARFLVAIDTLYNPQRIEQLVGRIRRTGSVHKTVVFVMLMTRDTIEEKLFPRLERRQAVNDYVFGETSDIFDQLSPLELLQLFKD